jgi:hypothetical protein
MGNSLAHIGSYWGTTFSGEKVRGLERGSKNEEKGRGRRASHIKRNM